MPLERAVSRGTTIGGTTPVSTTNIPTTPVKATPIVTRSGGQLNFGVSPQQGQAQLRTAAAAHSGGFLDPLSSPIHQLLDVLSQPVYGVGSAIRGHPLETLRHFASLPVKATEFALPGSSRLLEKIPGIKPHESVLPSQALRERGWLPGGNLGAVLGVGADIFADPLTYATFGAGGAISAARKVEHLAELANISKTLRTAEKSGLYSPAELQKVTQQMGMRHAAAQDAFRAERGRGAHVNVGLAGTRVTKEIGTLPGSRLVSRGGSALKASKYAKALRSPEGRKASAGFQDYFFAGGTQRKTPTYRAQLFVRRAMARQKQVISRQSKDMNREFALAVKARNKSLGKGEGLNLTKSQELLSHHIQQPGKFAVPKEFEPFVPRVRELLDRWHKIEQSGGVRSDFIPDYLPHVFTKSVDRERFGKAFGERSLASPFFVKHREVPNIETLQKLKYSPETNPFRLLEIRGHAHAQAMADQGIQRGIAAETGVRRPLPEPVDVAGAKATAGAAREELKRVSAPQPLDEARAAVGETRGLQQGAQLVERVSRRVPHLARRSRAARALGAARAARGEGATELAQRRREFVALERGTPRGEHPPEVLQAQQAVDDAAKTLAEARATVERQRRIAVKAAASKDPLVRSQARRELSRAIRTHIDARIALANLRGRTVGSVAKVQQATRQNIKAQSALTRAEREAPRVQAIRERIASQPGKPVNKEEWKTLQGEWERISGRWNKDILIPPEQKAVIDRIVHEMNRSFKHHQSAGQVSRFVGNVTSHWKSLALVSPGYHFRNAIGDAIGAWWAGARNPVSYAQAARIVMARDDPAKLAKLRIKVGGERMTGEEFLREADTLGISGQGQAGTEIRQAQEGVRGRLNAPGRGRIARASQAVGQAREDATRLGTYLDLRRQGMDSISAATRTHDFLFDYGHVSDFIEQARRFWIPFITYTSKAAPRTVKQALTRPGYFTHHAELANALNQAAGVQEPMTNLPFGSRDVQGIPDPGGILHRILSLPRDKPITWNPERVSPWGVLNTLDIRNPQQTLLSNLPNPFVKTGVEGLTGHRLYYAGNAPRRAVAPPLIQALERAGIPIPDFGPKASAALGRDVPGYSALTDAILNSLPVYGQQQRLTNLDDRQKWAQSVLSFLTGAPISSYDRAELLARAQKYAGK